MQSEWTRKRARYEHDNQMMEVRGDLCSVNDES